MNMQTINADIKREALAEYKRVELFLKWVFSKRLISEEDVAKAKTKERIE